MSIQLHLGESSPVWVRVEKSHPAALALADRHYSRQTPGSPWFTPPGRTLVLVTPCGRALWSVVENLDNAGAKQWRVTMFRNEGEARSSALIVEATELTRRWWSERFSTPKVPLTTEVDPSRVRRKRDPGRCFLRAGWTRIGTTRDQGLVLLRAPEG